ncbi:MULTISPECIES: indolepyruvate oxidoreductase subunit beta [Anaerotruncus]|jgi:indolepyruvate ferredoxin oxidoreductase beta subunit|uniref:indolepyruvate oxidoreductase subunit beta n=1 Tax=Anaerotruncus TaxID=244127 RepID=UPI0008311530|nr:MULTISPECIES: indolepyruvate oxidoreductase subunit beta [Anaerotruncus]RGX56628.1 indolepyruvate oxidoreductase subunit beta [Anaerotruncus sp. AF02-27]
MSNVKSIMIVGVGGQGSLLASKLMGNVLMAQGFDVKVSEVHGMAQRGGSVVTYVKYGDKVYSPVIAEGEADVIVSFEKLEAARWLPFLKEGGKLIVNDQEIDPMPVITGVMPYPTEIFEKLTAKGVQLVALDALKLAHEAGSAKAVNVVLIGVLSSMLDFSDEVWQRTIEKTVPAKFLELNKKAFALGRSYKG